MLQMQYYITIPHIQVTFADCYGSNHGRSGGVPQEEAALYSAAKLRAHNPAIKNVICEWVTEWVTDWVDGWVCEHISVLVSRE